MKRINLAGVLVAVLMNLLPWTAAQAEDVSTALVPGKFYAFRHVQANAGTIGQVRYMRVTNDRVLNADVVSLPSGATPSDRNYIFAVEDAGDGKYFIRNVGTGLYLHRPGKVGNNTNVSTSRVPTLADNAYWITNTIVADRPDIFALGDAVQMASGPVASQQYFLHNNNESASTAARVVRWSVATTAGNNSQWYVEEITNLPDYYINYADDATASGSRYPGKITVTTSTGSQEQTWATAAGHALYKDCTESLIVNVKAGEQFTIAYGGGDENWMHFYAYLDYGRDGQFSWEVDEGNHRAMVGSDLVAWSFYAFNQSADTGGWDSDGTYYTGNNRNTKVLPGTISAPSTAGDYRMRVKLDWSNVDPAGATASHAGGAMQANGGAILDFTLRVTGSAYNLTFEDAAGQPMDAVRVYTPSGTSACGSGASVNSDVDELVFAREDWQLLKATSFRSGGNTYSSWAVLKAAVGGGTNVTVVLTPSTSNITAGRYYALRHVQVESGDYIGEVRYARVNGTVMNADPSDSPAQLKDLTRVFKLTDAGSGLFYLYNAGTNLFVKSPGAVGNNANITTSATATNAANAYYVTNAMVPGNEEAFALGDASVLRDPLAQAGEQYFLHNSNENSGTESMVVRWSTAHTSSNSLWYLDEVTVPVVTITFKDGDMTVTPPYTIIGGDNTLSAQSKMQTWSTDIEVGDAYLFTGWELDGVTYETKQAFFEAMHALTEDGVATLTIERKDYFPLVGNSYLIAAQTWNGQKWVERMLVNSSETTLCQTTDYATATAWTIESGEAAGDLRIKSPTGKYIIYGGLNSSATDVTIAEPTDWTSGENAKALTIYSKAGAETEWRYVVARNNGGNFESGDKSTSETGLKPKTSQFTPYFRFYDSTQKYLTVTENLPNVATYKIDDATLASDAIIPLASIEGKTLSVNANSFNAGVFKFLGFFEGDTELGKTYTIPAGGTANRTITARFDWCMLSNTYGEKWVTIRNNNLGTYAATYDDGGTTRIKPMALGSSDEFKWCLVKTEGGFYIYNKGVGNGKVVTLDGNADDGTTISMQEISDTNPERQIWTLVYDGTSVGIVPANHTSRGWNPYAADTNPLKLFDVTGNKSRWQLIEVGKSTYTDRAGNYVEDGAKYTFISAYSEYYNRQKVYKAVYLNTSDDKLYWKTYDPSDDTFYFRAHVSDTGVLTMECVGKPGYYLTGAADVVAETGNAVTLPALGNGICNIRINGQASLHTNNHGSGGGGGSNIVAYGGGIGSASAWYVQRADMKALEVERYAQELADRQAAADEAVRQAARQALKDAIDACVIGYEFGQYTQEAVDAAQAVYDDDTKTTAEYQAARTTLLGSINPPQTNTYFKIKTAFSWNDSRPRVMSVGKSNVLKWKREKESLYQLWQVALVDEDDHSHVAFINLGSGTYMNATVENGGTTTTNIQRFVRLSSAGSGAYYIETLNPSGSNTRFHTGDHGEGVNAEGNIMPWDGGRNTWLLEEVSEMDMSTLAYDEDNRIQARADLLACINEIQLHSTTNNAIGYRALSAALAAAQAIYDDETNTKAEYLDAIDALRSADEAATVIEPVEGQTYVLMQVSGGQAMHKNEDSFTMNIYDDTIADQFWTITHGEGNTYTFTCGETEVELNLTPAGNDRYEIEYLSDTYGLFIILPGSVGTDHGYLTNGTYHIVNATNTSKVLVNNGILVARAAIADIDDTCTDHLQIWNVTKVPGADRYIVQNVETNRYLGQPEIAIGAQVMTAPLASVFHLEATATEGQYNIYTTQGSTTQLCITNDGGTPRLKVADTNAAWMFVPATPQDKPVVRYPAVRIKNYGKADSYMSAVNLQAEQKALTAVDNPEKAMWVLVPHDFEQTDGTTETRYGIRNAYSGLYMQNITSNNAVLAAGATPVYYTKSEPDATRSNTVSFRTPGGFYLNAHGGNTTIIGYNQADNNSHWYIENVTDGNGDAVTYTEDELMIKADAYEGFCAPADGMIVRITNCYHGTYMDEDYNAKVPHANGYNGAKYTQLWRLHYDETEAMYSLENLYTGHFLANQQWNNTAYYMADEISTAGMFTIACNPSFVGQRIYNIIDSRCGRYVHNQSTSLLVPWSNSTNGSFTASEWRFKPVTLTDEEIADIKAKWEENKNMINNRDKYQGILDQIFADKACTIIREGLADSDYDELVAQLPDLLADMCNKVKNNAWQSYPSGRNWEKAFRIAEHGVVSNSGAMSNLVAVDYGFSRLSDPTGIKASANEIVAFMVDSNTPAGASLKVECQSGFGMSGGQITLNKGLNLIAMEQDTNMFICYMIDSGSDDPANYVENYPDIKIHIEGGEVFGKLDRTRVFEVEKTTEVDGTNVSETETYDMRSHHAWSTAAANARNAADSLWVRMKADGLLTNGYMTQVKSDCILFNFASSEFLAACPEKIGEVTDIWDWMMKSEQFIMGMRNNWTIEGQNGELIDTYIPNFSKRFNNIYMATERTGGYMNATGYGAMYTVGTAGSILNFNNLKAGGAIWGPAHEHGHDHQKLINMIGMSEVSNNLFSNVANYYHGTLVSRGASLPDVINNYVNGGHWFDLSIWNMTQMYYKLFLYYHAAHNKDDFYPLVFKKLRDGERIRRVQGVAVGAHEDYLRFALVCSEVAGEDLSDFFEAYGMFRAISPEVSTGVAEQWWVEKNGKLCREVGDYGTFYVYTDMDKVAEVKEKIKACGPRNSSLLFIEDRVTKEEATNPFSNEGDMKGNRGDGGVVGAYGNLGQYSDYDQTSDDYDPNATTGYMVYDEDGNLLYFTATDNGDGEPVIPQTVIDAAGGEDNIVVGEVESNGNIIEQVDPNDEIFHITEYRYDANGTLKTNEYGSAGRMTPQLGANDVAVVAVSENANKVAARRVIYSRDRAAAERRLANEMQTYPFADSDNIIMSDGDGNLSMQALNIKDKLPLYLPKGTNARGPLTETVTYSRTNTAGWNSVCLPFAVTADDFGEGSRIYTLYSQDEESVTLRETSSVPAATPCFVNCPDEVSSWTISRDVEDNTSTDVTAQSANDIQLNGSFENKGIGEGKYKISSNGTAIGRTTAKATVTAFRGYLESVAGGSLNAPSYILRIFDETATGVNTTEYTMEAGQAYDLSGRQIARPEKGKPYIMNGKIRIDR